MLGSMLLFTALHAEAGEKKPALYQERYRPQYHFTADRGWINDPNGLVYVNGVYHLFFQHERPGARWGHATSTDLLHWTQHADAIVPVKGHKVFSGSAVVDEKNTSGFQIGDAPPVVAVFTSWGEGQCLAYSNNDGMTFTRYNGNPVLKLPGDKLKSWQLSSRDPHVMWDKEKERWVMVLYANPDQRKDKRGSGFSIFTSPDLRKWKKQSHLQGFYVCPDVFRLPIEGEPGKTSWIAMDWERYTTGEFDEATFTPKAEIRKLDFGKNLSANQSWKHLPGGRIIQICWLREGKYPGMPFDQQLSFPTELTLRRIDKQILLCKNPIPEIRKLHCSNNTLENLTLKEGESREIKDLSQSLDIDTSFTLEPDAEISIGVLNQKIRVTRGYVQSEGRKGRLPGKPEQQNVRILAVRTSIEIFANRGSLTMAFCLVPKESTKNVTVKSVKGKATFSNFSVREVSSIWKAGTEKKIQDHNARD
jgi:fructan beta-fructosidase